MKRNPLIKATGDLSAYSVADGSVNDVSPAFRKRFDGAHAAAKRYAHVPKDVVRLKKARLRWDKIQDGTITGPAADGLRRDYAKEFAIFEAELRASKKAGK